MNQMKTSQRLWLAITLVLLTTVSFGASAAIIVADTEIDYFNSGANGSFSTGYYGGTLSGFPIALLDASNATDGDATTFVSLPTGSYLTLGFSTGFVFDGVGNDLFVAEIGAAAENAQVWISADWGSTFTYLGIALGNTVSEFDLADISYTGTVNAVKIVGLDNNGGSPGFDLAYVQGLEGSVTLPGPASLAIFLFGLIAIGFRGLKRSARR